MDTIKNETIVEENYIDKMLSTTPQVNVITKDKFEKRVKEVFEILWEKLSVTFGPGGSGTFVSVYPNYYNTKDGFSVMKNIGFREKIDQVITDMVMNICSRLNFTVGDGTTTAVIATRSMYESYQEKKPWFESKHILPRKILKEFESIKNELLTEIDKNAIPIRSDDPEVLKANIAKVVDISSNGNEVITAMISDMYSKLMYPAITCNKASDGITKSKIIEGYKINTSLTDKIYINNDDNTMILSHADFIVFDHKVTQETYTYILKPLMEICRSYGRHLVCIAPYYDEVALQGTIRKELNEMNKKYKDIPLVLTVCSNTSASAKRNLDDLTMLLNTSIITLPMEHEMVKKQQESGNQTFPVFNIDCRHIPGIMVGVIDESASVEGRTSIKPVFSQEVTDDSQLYNAQYEDTFRLGHADNVTLGLNESTFSGFYYDEDLYNKYVSVAKDELKDIQEKCKNLGAYSPQLIDAQKRVYALGLKTGIIEVGATSEISQGYLKDTFDDAIKAAKSAFNNGIVLGCNVTTLSILENMSKCSSKDTLRGELIELLSNGFKKVYETVISSVFDSNINLTNPNEFIECMYEYGYATNVTDLVDRDFGEDDSEYLWNYIIDISVRNNVVLDLSTGKFGTDVVNSAETDKEIIKAVIDLLSLLITGNQLVLR